MPVVFRVGGARFFFYSNEGSPREPPHIHVEDAGSEAVGACRAGAFKGWYSVPIVPNRRVFGRKQDVGTGNQEQQGRGVSQVGLFPKTSRYKRSEPSVIFHPTG